MAAGVSVSGGEVKTPVGTAPVMPLIMLGLGGYLAWFGAKYWRQDVRWPSDPIKAVLQGKPLTPSTPPPAQASLLAAYEAQGQQAAAGGGGGGGSAYQGPLPAGAAQNTAKLLLQKFGWDLSQFAALNQLWGTDESGWNPTARNPTSGAFGIAQALGHGGADTAAPDGTNEYGAQYGLTAAEAQQANSGSARWQIEWGLGYIKDRYGSPQAALAFEQSHTPYWY